MGSASPSCKSNRMVREGWGAASPARGGDGEEKARKKLSEESVLILYIGDGSWKIRKKIIYRKSRKKLSE